MNTNTKGMPTTTRGTQMAEKTNQPKFNAHGYQIQTSVRYGRRGAGYKVHRLIAKQIVGLTNELRANAAAQPRTLAAAFIREENRTHGTPREIFFSVTAACNGNGQHTATVYAELGEEDVNCKSCGAHIAKVEVSS